MKHRVVFIYIISSFSSVTRKNVVGYALVLMSEKVDLGVIS